MKIKEMISELQHLCEKHGDVEVYVPSYADSFCYPDSIVYGVEFCEEETTSTKYYGRTVEVSLPNRVCVCF